MTELLKEFKFDKPPNKIVYFDKEPLKLSNELIFFHNKSKFRKYITQLQYLIKSYTNVPLHAAGIRDSYLKEEISEKFLIIILSNSEIIKKTNEIVEPNSEKELKNGCFYIETNTNFMLLLSRDIEGLILGIKTMESILKQVMDDYMIQKKFDDYIKVRTFELIGCNKSL
ncbi:MAG: hypothetical protein ACFFCE_16750 [Promethearchaeota archaeon]